MSKIWKRVTALSICLAILTGAATTTFVHADDEEAKPKHTIKDVMKEAMKGGLLKKVTSGDASAEEKTKLLDLFISMVENKPPKGEMESWHNLAGASALAAAKVVVGREGALEELKAATNCKACHSVHKP